MAKFIVSENIEKYIDKIYALETNFEKMCRGAVGEGAKFALDAIRKNIESLPVDNYNRHTAFVTGVSESEKRGLLESLGATEMENENGYIYTKIGFAGYNDFATKSYPKGHPNAMIARSIVKGTSWRKRFPFVDKAFKADQVIQKIDGYIENSIEQIEKKKG